MKPLEVKPMRRKRRSAICVFLIIVGVSLITAGSAVCQSSRPGNRIQTFRLPNGLKLVTLEDHSVPLVTLHVWYHVGSKDEPSGRTGFAHLFEHLMLKGSARLAPDEYEKMINEMGGYSNAHTSFDFTYYEQSFPSGYLERVMWMEADRMRSLNVNESNFTSEREVVKEERRMRIDNQPYGSAGELILKNAFPAGPYNHIVLGSMEDLNKASVADVKEFYETYYQPGNATVVIVGDFNTARALHLARKHFGALAPAHKPVPRAPEAGRPAGVEKRFVEYDPRISLPALVEAYYIPRSGCPDNYALAVAANILSQGQSSRLYRSLVYEKQIALATIGVSNSLENAGLFYALAVMGLNHKVEEGEAAIDEVIGELRDKPVSDAELTKAKNQIIASLIFDRQSNDQKARALGAAAMLLDDPKRINGDVEKYRAVTAADLQRVIKQYFVASNRLVVKIIPPQQRTGSR
jgi:zinc protease